MPKVTVYVREEDYPLWKSINKKTEFIHGALQVMSEPGKARLYAAIATRRAGEGDVEFKPIKKPIEAVKVLADRIKPCKHGYTPSMCRFAKNGKPCK